MSNVMFKDSFYNKMRIDSQHVFNNKWHTRLGVFIAFIELCFVIKLLLGRVL